MSEAYRRLGDPEDMISALVMPLEGHTSSEVLKLLQQHDVQDASQLATEIVSTRAPRRVLQLLESIARVEPKVPKSMHRR
jgi:hypothetical protein